jgi:hypothetical protein
LTTVGANPARMAPITPARASVRPREAPKWFPACWANPKMAAPAKIDARLPHKASCANQFNICDNNWAPGIPADVGETDTCANHNVTFTANLLVAERTGAQGNGSRRAYSEFIGS